MFTSTSQGDILIEFTDEKVVGIKLSGGMDSAIIFYMVCKHIRENNLQTAILPITLDNPEKRYNGEFAKRVLYWIKQNFPTIEILPHELREAPGKSEGWVELSNDDWIYQQEKLLYEIHQQTPFNIYFTGITKNPPKEVYLQFYNSEKDLMIGPNDDRDSLQPISIEHPYFWNTDGYWQIGRTKDQGVKQGEMVSINLLAQMDKLAVTELYDQFNLRQTLLLSTRSCENYDPVLTNNFTTHCHTECWWCHERHWGLGEWPY